MSQHCAGAHQTFTYDVIILDNFHYYDPDEEYVVSGFCTCQEAIAYAKNIIDVFLTKYKDGMTADELYSGWVGYGETPLVHTDDPECHFLGTDYAREQTATLCGSQVTTCETS